MAFALDLLAPEGTPSETILPLEYRKASRRRAITDNLARIVDGGGWHRQIRLVSLADPGTVLRALKDIFIFWE